MSRDGGVLDRESGVSLRVRGRNLGSPGLELYSSHSMKPVSLREPEMEALQLKGLLALSGVEKLAPPLGDMLMGLEAAGGELETGMERLWCRLEVDSSILQVRPLLRVLDLLRWFPEFGLVGLPFTDMDMDTGLVTLPSPSLAVLIRQDVNFLPGDVAAMLSVLDLLTRPVWLGGRLLRLRLVGTEMGLVLADWLLLLGLNSESSFMAFMASRMVSWMFCATTESSACIQNSPGPVTADRPTSMKKKLSECPHLLMFMSCKLTAAVSEFSLTKLMVRLDKHSRYTPVRFLI